MVAIVTGNGLGLSGSSASVLGSSGQLGVAGTGVGGDSAYVNAQTGNLVIQRQDELLIGKGPDIGIVRTYNSLGGFDFDNNDKWQLSLYRQLSNLTGGSGVNTVGSQITRTGADGAVLVYTYDNKSGKYINKDGGGSYDTLTFNSGNNSWTWEDGDSRIKETYLSNNGTWRISQVVDPAGQALTYTYTGELITEITDANGERTKLSYNNATDKQLECIEVWVAGSSTASTRTRYTYQNGLLTRVTTDLTPADGQISDNNTFITEYTYDNATNKRITSITSGGTAGSNNGTKVSFSYYPDGKIWKVTDGTGNVTEYTYGVTTTATTSTTTIKDANGQITTLTYNTSGSAAGQLIKIVGPAGSGINVEYTYNANGDVTQVTDSRGKITTYGYDLNGNRIREQDAAGNVIERLYGSFNQLLAETKYSVDGAGSSVTSAAQTTRYVYSNDSKNQLRFVISPEGRVTEYRYDAAGQRLSDIVYAADSFEVGALDNWLQDFSTDTAGLTINPATFVTRVNGQLQFTSTRQVDPIYPTANTLDKPLGTIWSVEVTTPSTISPNLLNIGVDSGVYGTANYRRHRIQFSQNNIIANYGEVWAGSLMTIGTAKPDTTYVLEFVTETNGTTTAYVYEKGKDRSSGLMDRRQYSNVSTNSTRLSMQSFSGSGASTGAGASTYIWVDNIRSQMAPQATDLEAWVNSITKSASQRIDYSYDPRGALKSRTVYGKVDSAGEGINDANKSTTYYSYDAAGNLLQVIDGRGTENGTSYLTSYAYDGLNRIVFQTDAAGIPTTTVYSDASRQVAVTLVNGLQTITTYDQAGRVTSVSQRNANTNTALGTTNYFYDSLGQLRQVKDALDRSVYYLYDTAGRKVGEIDGEKSLTEIIYNANGQVIATRRYANLVTASLTSGTTLTLAGVRPANHADDRITRSIYDAAGRLVREINETWAVTSYTYDGVGRLLTVTRYAKILDTAQQTTISSGSLSTELQLTATTPVADSANDRVTRRLYDNDGLLVGELDGEGYLTEHTYDKAGRLTQSTRYANKSAAAQWANGILDQLRPATNTNQDQTTTRLYNAQGQLVGIVDAENYLTTYQYDQAGNETERKRYTNAMVGSLSGNTLPQIVSSAGSGNYVLISAEDQTLTSSYNARNQLTRTISSPTGLIIEHSYDNVGKLITTKRSTSTTDARSVAQRYDTQGRLIAELTAEGTKALAAITGPTQTQLDTIWNSYGTRYVYDAAGQRIATLTPDGSTASGNRTRHYYDNDGRLTHSINAEGEVIEYVYNAFDEIVAERRYNTRIASTVLANLLGGQKSSLGTAISDLGTSYSEFRTEYDKTGRVLKQFDALNYETPREYNAFGELKAQWTPLNSTTKAWATFAYDRRGYVVGEFKEAINPTTITLDAFGRKIAIQDPRYNTTTYAYDRLGRLITVSEPGVPSVSTTYDAHDRVLTKVDGRGFTTSYIYNSAQNKLVIRSSEGIEVTTVSNGFGETVSVTNGRGQVTSYTYDADGRLTRTTNPDTTININIYDKAGRLIMSRDGRSTDTQYFYDAANRLLTRVVNPGSGNLNLTTNYLYDAQGRKAWEQDAAGIWTQTSYNAKGEITSIIVDPKRGPTWATGAPDNNPNGLNLETRFTYDARGKTLSVTEGFGTSAAIKTAYVYDQQGRRLEEIVDPDGLKLKTTYTYSGTGYVLSKTDPAGNTTRYTYDASNRLIHTIDALGQVTVNLYDGNGNIIKVTRYATAISLAGLPVNTPLGDANTRVAAIANATQDRVTQYVYDKDNRLKFSVDANGYVTRLEYDGEGNVVKRTQYLNKMQGTLVAGADIEIRASGPGTGAYVMVSSLQDRVEQTVYDKMNRVSLTVDAEGYVTAYLYTANGGLYQTTRYANPVMRRESLGINNTPSFVSTAPSTGPYVLTSAQDQLSQKAYDAGHRPIFSWDAERNVTEYQYDGNGRVIKEIRYANKLEGSLAVYPGRPSVIAANATPPTSGVNVRLHATDDRTTQYLYDNAGRLKDTINAVGETTRHAYDAAGNLTDKTVAFGTALAVTTHYNYDLVGRLIEEIRAYNSTEAVTTRYEYNGLGNQTKIIEAYGTTDQRTTEQKFDIVGRKIEAIDALGNSIKTEYNAFGDIVKLTDANGQSGYFYTDKLGRVTLQINPEGAVTQYEYNAFGEQTKLSKLATPYTGTINTTTPPSVTLSAARDQVQEVSYNLLGQKTLIKTWFGVGANDYYSEVFSYDVFGNVKTATSRYSPGASPATTTYTYDKLNRKVSETLPITSKQPNGTTPAVVNTFDYDAAGNLIKKIEAQGLVEQRITLYTYDRLNRIVSEKGEAIDSYNPAANIATSTTPTKTKTYDARGNVISEVDANGNATSYVYDVLNRLIYQGNPDGVLTSWTYDAVGNKISQTIFANKIPMATPDASKDRTTLYSYDLAGRLTGTEIQNITYGNVNTANQYVVSTGSVTTQTAYDALGNVVKQIDANGNITRTWYNNAGQSLAQVDALGYLTVWTRDSYGNITKEARYAKKLSQSTLQLITQDNTSLAQIISAASSLSDKSNDRVMTITFDKLNRVTSEVLSYLISGTVNTTNGALTTGTTSATTSYLYDGLNNITQKTDATGAVTDWTYDNLGRRLTQKNPQFNDYTSTSATTGIVRPRTDWEYDGLGNVKREIARGTNDDVETDDHITIYTYDIGGRLASEIDATSTRIEYLYDANGNITKKTLKARITADGTSGDDITTYSYDSLNRQVKNKDQGTGLISEVQYNSFGEVSGKRSYVINTQNPTAPNAWQEYVQYDQAGRIWKTNSGDGITKVYVYDKNGNATLSITSTLDVTSMSLDQILAIQNGGTQHILYNMNIYDAKNQLVNTIQPSQGSIDVIAQASANTTSDDAFISTPTEWILETLANNPQTQPYTTSSEYKNDRAFAVIKTDGSVVTWGDPLTGGDSSLVALELNGTIPVVQIYSTSLAFAALRADGSVITWGYPSLGGSSTQVANQLNGSIKVIQISSMAGAFAALREDGSVVTWGNVTNATLANTHLNGNVKVKKIYSTAGAFAALKEDGTVFTWGDPNSGGSTTLTPGSHKVMEIYSTGGAFAALTDRGYVYVWGDATRGGNASSVLSQLNGYVKVTTVYSNGYAFAAIREDGSVVTWGDINFGGYSNGIGVNNPDNKVTTIVASVLGFAALREDGSVVGWGGNASLSGGYLNGQIKAVRLFSNNHAFAALREDGTVYTWGNTPTTGLVPILNGTIRVINIYSTSNGGFAALREDGSVVTWGDASMGGDSSAVATQLNGTIKVKYIYSTRSAFAALREDGSIITWGNSNEGGDSNIVADQLTENVWAFADIYTDTRLTPTNNQFEIRITPTSPIVSKPSVSELILSNIPEVAPGRTAGEHMNAGAFAAIKDDGSIATWGYPEYGGDSSSVSHLLNGNIKIIQIYSSAQAFAALREDGSVITWGAGVSGGDSSTVSGALNSNPIPQLNSGIKTISVYSTFGAFAALREDGSVITWGIADGGGDSSSVANQLNGSIKVISIYSSGSAFAALREDGSVITWGTTSLNDGTNILVSNQLDGSIKVTKIVSTDNNSFLALREDGSVVSWGKANYGGNSSAVANQLDGTKKVTDIFATNGSFAALREDGNVISWGMYIGNNNPINNGSIQKIYTSQSAFAALLGNGSVIAWGDSMAGGDASTVSTMLDGTVKVVDIYATTLGFSALREDGSVVILGSLGEAPASQLLPDSLVGIYAAPTNSFVALYKSGLIVTWGAYSLSPLNPVYSLLNGSIKVTNISYNSQGFSALRADGSVVSWGNPLLYDSGLVVKAGVVSIGGITTDNSIDTYHPPIHLDIIQPKEAEYITISYRLMGKNGPYTDIQLTPTSLGHFDWNATELVTNPFNNYDYEISIKAYASENVLVNQNNAIIRLGKNSSVLSNTKITTPSVLYIEPTTPNVNAIQFSYRLVGSGNYIPVDAILYEHNGTLKFRVNLLSGNSALATGDYEYKYTAYNSLGNVIGNVTGKFSIIKNPANRDITNWVISSIDSNHAISLKKNYNAFGEVIQEVDGLGNITDFNYNTLGKVILKRDALTDITLANGYIQKNFRPETIYTYDQIGRLVAVKDANNNVNVQAWLNGTNNIAFERHADGGIKNNKYDIFTNQRVSIDEVNRRTDYTYDAKNRLTRIDRPQRISGTAGYITTRTYDVYTYDALDNRISHTDSLGNTEKTYFDSLGRIIQTKSFLGFSTSYVYDYSTTIIGLGDNLQSGWIKTTTNIDSRIKVDKLDMYNRVTWHQDLGGHQFTYSYNRAGWLVQQTGTTGQDIAYEYYESGYIKAIHDKALGVYTYYDYDKNGNKIFEGYINLVNPISINEGVNNYYQYSYITYDTLNRIKSINDPIATINYEYDAVGNKRYSKSVYVDSSSNGLKRIEYWYTYDSMNRFTITMGQLGTMVNGSFSALASGARPTSETASTIIHPGKTLNTYYDYNPLNPVGVAITYNFAGERVQVFNAGDGSTENYTYTADGYLADVYIKESNQTAFVLRSRKVNDALGRVTSLTNYSSGNSTGVGSAQTYIRNITYDEDGRVNLEWGDDGSSTYYYFSDSSNTASSTTSSGTLAKIVTTKNGTTLTTTYSYSYWDDAKQLSIKEQPSNASAPGWKAGYTDITYNLNGDIASALDHVGNRSLTYLTNAQGLILKRNEISGPTYKTVKYLYVDGKRVGGFGDDESLNKIDYVLSLARQSGAPQPTIVKPRGTDFDQNYDPILPNNVRNSSDKYTVHTGDTLQSIARTVWGDSSMWYLIADANGLTSGQDLIAGQTLVIPNKITNVYNNTGTFRVYNPNEAMGDVTPTIPDVPPPVPKKNNKGKCGGMGGIIVAVVTVVVAVIAQRYELIPQVIQSMGPAATAAAAAGIGNIAGQVTGNVIGVQKGFDVRSFGTAVVSAGVTQGVLGTVDNPTAFGSALSSAVGGGYAAVAARAVVGNVVYQGLGNATGAQKGFSWSSVAVSSIAAAGGAALTDQLGMTTTNANGITRPLSTTLSNDFGIAAANAGVNALTQLAIRGGRINWQQVATDTITGFLQNSISGLPKDNNAASGIKLLQAKKPGIQIDSEQGNIVFANFDNKIPVDDYDFNLRSYTQQLQFELAGQEEQLALYFGAALLPTGAASVAAVRHGPTMVVNRGWDAALNIAADPFGLIEPLQSTMSALNQLSATEAKRQLEDTRAQLDKLGVKNLPGNIQAWDRYGNLTTDYQATGKMLASAYEASVRDARLRATWGDDYKNIRIGKSGYTPQQFEEVSLNLQQDTMNKAAAEGMDNIVKGKLALQKDSMMLTLGNYADRAIRDSLRDFYKSEGLSESAVYRYAGVNRKITNGLLAGIPDLRLGNNLYSDSTLALKNAQTEQLRRWVTINANAYNVVIRPTMKLVPNYNPGSYVISPRDIAPISPTINNRYGRL